MSREGNIIRELRQAGFTVLNRKQWGSRRRGVYQTRRRTRRFVGAADHLFAHITVTHPGSDPRAAMRQLEDIGYSRFGTGVSYNYALHRASKTILIGMPHDAAGAHTLNDKNVSGFPDNLNYWGHATALIGMPGEPFDQWCVDAAAAIEAAEKKHGACKPGAHWYPHSKFAWKECPTNSFRNKLGAVARRADTVLGRNPAPKPKDPLEEIMAWYKNRADFENSIARAILRCDDIPVPPNFGTPESRKANPTWQLRSVLGRLWRDNTDIRESQRTESRINNWSGDVSDLVAFNDEKLAEILPLLRDMAERLEAVEAALNTEDKE